MSDFRKVTEQLMVSPQISTTDIDAAATEGVTLIINNRPDFEEDGQPTNEELSSYAATKGIKWAHIPVAGGQLTMEGIETMSYALKDSDKVLAYCRSGTRSCNMWGLAEAYVGGMDPAQIVAAGAAAGYDLSGMTPTFQHLHANAG